MPFGAIDYHLVKGEKSLQKEYLEQVIEIAREKDGQY